ncbi:gamma-glutamylcyclotransferase [Thalassotalea sp. PS06]|uniref:gamma-glutamylcyclotransferase n=1 Tax=Thalassotalea sp. PS06 TaxID=2594005 RepID=UPI0021B10F4B|nr:gamma-glutamylcyclotransferase [Thalassotalea sp. PS06]
MGFPGIVLDTDGPEVNGQVFASNQLSDFWSQLDAFEGGGYQRVLVNATLDNGETVQVNIYEVKVPDA